MPLSLDNVTCLSLVDKCYMPYNNSPPMAVSPQMVKSPPSTTSSAPSTPATPHRNNNVQFDVSKEILALASGSITSVPGDY